MKRVEKESLAKSFVLFFLSQTVLVGALFFFEYKKEVRTLEADIFNEIRVCSFDLECPDFAIDFVPKGAYELYKPYKDQEGISGYFPIFASKKNLLKITYPQEKFEQKLHRIENTLITDFLFVLLVVVFLSFLFALYALWPLRQALAITEEFIKDILHDFNTPLSIIRLNVSMLHKECPKSAKLSRIENALATVLALQANLRAYLKEHSLQSESFDIKEVLNERVELLRRNYPAIEFVCKLDSYFVTTNKDSFVRVADNILSNAAKYNKQNGTVHIYYHEKKLVIQDTGRGIENPKKVFERFYKEQERGNGIGMHIVKKLCDAMGINITVESEIGVGTKVVLDLKNIIKNNTSS